VTPGSRRHRSSHRRLGGATGAHTNADPQILSSPEGAGWYTLVLAPRRLQINQKRRDNLKQIGGEEDESVMDTHQCRGALLAGDVRSYGGDQRMFEARSLDAHVPLEGAEELHHDGRQRPRICVSGRKASS
jgi:hypothetical protein